MVPVIQQTIIMIWVVKLKWICAVVITIIAITFLPASPNTIWRMTIISRCCTVIVTKNFINACTTSIRKCRTVSVSCISHCAIVAIETIIRLWSVLNMTRPCLFDDVCATLRTNHSRCDTNGSICHCTTANCHEPPNWMFSTKWIIRLEIELIFSCNVQRSEVKRNKIISKRSAGFIWAKNYCFEFFPFTIDFVKEPQTIQMWYDIRTAWHFRSKYWPVVRKQLFQIHARNVSAGLDLISVKENSFHRKLHRINW